MNALSVSITPTTLMPPSSATLSKLNEAHRRILTFPQVEIATEHLLHGGMYARTIRLAPGTVMMGSLILLATILVVQGECSFMAGDKRVDISGYNVLPGCAGRKQLFLIHGPVEMTMIFPTQATTIEAAEDEIFAEADQLISRKDGSRDTVTITGQ